MVAALTRHVTQQRIRLERSRAAAQLEQAVTDQMPELVSMQEFQVQQPRSRHPRHCHSLLRRPDGPSRNQNLI